MVEHMLKNIFKIYILGIYILTLSSKSLALIL